MRVKLFVIQVSKGGTWDSECLYKGTFRDTLAYAGRLLANPSAGRIVRVKTPAEFDELQANLVIFGKGAAQTEWVN